MNRNELADYLGVAAAVDKMVRRGSPLRAALGARQAEGVERGTRVPEKRQPVGLGYEQKRFLERFGNNTMNSDASSTAVNAVALC